MNTIKSVGVTPTEKKLTDLCERSFLKLWCYANPYNEERKELCDLLAVFENHVFIFFDREKVQEVIEDEDPLVQWERWKRNVVQRQINSVNGVERYLKKGRKVFLDNKAQVDFPIPMDPATITIHKIIIAHGAANACLNYSKNNINGSLAISYSAEEDRMPEFPFSITLDRNNPIHLFDSFNFSIILRELDTFYDFLSYLKAKEKAISKVSVLAYCGEEDLLADYFLNYDENSKAHYIGALEDCDMLIVPEGIWNKFIESAPYTKKKNADRISYFWDDLIQRTCVNVFENTVMGNANAYTGPSAIHEMAKEPRFVRRVLSNQIMKSIQNFPESQSEIVRTVSLYASYYPGKAYVFLQLKVLNIQDYDNEYRPKRTKLLEIACGAAKNKFNEFNVIIGIAIYAPKYSKGNSEDYLLLNCAAWSDSDRAYYENANKNLHFFSTVSQNIRREVVSEFPEL